MNAASPRDETPWQDSRHPQSGAIEIIAAEHADARAHGGPARFSRAWWSQLAAEVAKFGVVGGLGVLVDMGMFNLLRATVLSPDRVAWGPMAANVLATVVAIIFNWAGNRFWTFRHNRHHKSTMHEALEFFGVSIAGMLIGLVPLWITHYGWHWVSPLADNLSKFLGIVLGSIFRFILYRWWVYAPSRQRAAANEGTN